MRRTVRIVCDAESHAPKVARVDRLTFHDDALNPEGNVAVTDGLESSRLINDQVINRKALFGDSRTGPTRWDVAETRERRVLECPLCGLRVELRESAARRLAIGLADAGVSFVSLSSIAATL